MQLQQAARVFRREEPWSLKRQVPVRLMLRQEAMQLAKGVWTWLRGLMR